MLASAEGVLLWFWIYFYIERQEMSFHGHTQGGVKIHPGSIYWLCESNPINCKSNIVIFKISFTGKSPQFPSVAFHLIGWNISATNVSKETLETETRLLVWEGQILSEISRRPWNQLESQSNCDRVGDIRKHCIPTQSKELVCYVKMKQAIYTSDTHAAICSSKPLTDSLEKIK